MASTGQAGPSDPLALLLSLPLSHHSFLDLLRRVRASLLLSKSLSRLVGRLNACLLGSAGTVSAADKAIGWRAVEILVEKDESLVVDHGKGWLDVAMAATTVSFGPSGNSSSSSCSGGQPACSQCPTRCRAPRTIDPRLVEVPFLRAGKRPTTNGQTGGISWSASGQSCIRRGSQFIGVSLLSLSEYSSSDTDTPSRDHESHPGGNTCTISSFISGAEDSSASYHSQPSSPCFCSLFVNPAFTQRTYRGQNGRCGSSGTSLHDSRKISSFFRLVERYEGGPGWSELRGRWIRTGCLCRGSAVLSVVCYVPSLTNLQRRGHMLPSLLVCQSSHKIQPRESQWLWI